MCGPVGQVGSLHLQKTIGFTSFTFDSFMSCNFPRKIGLWGGGGLARSQKRKRFSSFLFDSHMASHSGNFIKKKQICGAGELASLSKKERIHFVYIWLSHFMQFFIGNCRKPGLWGGWACFTRKKGIYTPRLCLDSHTSGNFHKNTCLWGRWAHLACEKI